MSDKPSTVDKDATLARAAELVTREDAETRAALANPKRRRQMAAVMMWLLVVVNIVFWVVVPPPPLDSGDQRAPGDVERDVRLSIAVAAGGVDAYKAEHAGVLPRSLEEALVADSTLTYAKLDSVTYEVRGKVGAAALAYRSTVPLGDFLSDVSAGRP